MFISYEHLTSFDKKFSLLRDLPKKSKENKSKLAHLYREFHGLNYVGNLDLLKSPKIAIIGSRSPNQYAKILTHQLSSELSKKGFVIISGGAIGIDCIAHSGSFPSTIMCSPAGININYPIQNVKLIQSIREQTLLISEYEDNFMPYKSSFLERNRIIIALSDIVIIPYADLKSGSSSSANLAVLLQKEIYTLPHRIGESSATNELLENDQARAIFNISSFVANLQKRFFNICEGVLEDDLLVFASMNGSYEEALERFGDRVLLYEVEGKIKRVGLNIYLS